VLIVTPLRPMYHTWPGEIHKWRQFKGLRPGLLHGARKMETLHGHKGSVYLINPEGIDWLTDQLAKMKRWPFDVLVVDESTKFKDSRTKRFKALRKLIPKFKRRYILTGTVAPNGLLDLFGQIYILDEGHSLGRYITHYRNMFFVPGGYGGYSWSPRQDAMEEIVERIKPLVFVMNEEDVVKLPKLINNYIWLDLPEQARRVYRDLEEEFLTILEDDIITAPSAAAAGVKCRQVLNGALYINSEHDWREVHKAKLDALQDLVEELSGDPLLLLYEFEHDAERLEKLLGWPRVGKGSPKKDNQILDNFNKGILPGIIAHPASAGHGLNLQEKCANVCWFGLTWNLEHYDQAIRRVWRQGNSATRVINHHICIRNSLDETVVQALAQKDRTQRALTDLLRGLPRS